jgi:hypothetical protein
MSRKNTIPLSDRNRRGTGPHPDPMADEYPFAPHTYLPPCPDCGPENTERDEWACAKCNAAVPVCENCRTFIKGCPCGHCQTGAHAIEEGAD